MTSPQSPILTSKKNHLPIARFGKTYGIKGWLKLHSYADPAEQILEYPEFFLETPEGWETIKIDGIKTHGKGFIAHIKGFNVPETVQDFVGKTIAISSEALPELTEGEYYWRDLEGLNVLNQAGETLGKIAKMIEGPQHDVIMVKGTKKHLIPYDKQYVLSIDLEKQEMVVDWELDWS